jgi:DNA primase
MMQRTPATSEDRHKREENRAQRLAALQARMQQQAGEIRTARDWATCLRAAAQLPGENWANVLLISFQRPGATQVKGYEAWRAAGRRVNRDEKGIEIFSGKRQQQGNRRDPDDDEQEPSWRDAHRVAYVWDLSQTSGQAQPVQVAIPSSPGEVPAGLQDALCWLARREGFAVERENSCPADGATLWATRRIRVRSDLTSGQSAWALAHQLGHALLHDTIAHPPIRVPSPVPPSWPQESASPKQPQESAASWTAICRPAAPA